MKSGKGKGVRGWEKVKTERENRIERTGARREQRLAERSWESREPERAEGGFASLRSSLD